MIAGDTRHPSGQRRDARGLRPRALHARSQAATAARPRPDAGRAAVGRDRAPELYGRAYAASFPDSRFESIPEAGHLPHLEQPEQVLAAIHRFADETTRSA